MAARSILGRVHLAAGGGSSSYGTVFHGFRLLSTAPSSKLFVGGLSWSTDEQALTDAFSSYGHVSEAKVVLDRETGRSRGFGFVSFMSIEDAESAKEAMDGNDMNGRTIRVDFATEKPPSALPFGGFGAGGGGSLGRGLGRASVGASFADSNKSSFSSQESRDSFGRDSFCSKDGFASDSLGNDSFDTDEESFDNDLFDDHKAR